MTATVAEKIDGYFSKFPHRSYPKGQILVFADESPEHIFYLVKGRVRKYDISYRGEEVIVNLFKPPAFFPMSWAINRTTNKYYYKTEVETELHVVPVDAALDFLKANPDVMLDLLGRIYRGMDGLLGKMVHLMSGTAKSRIIYDLIIEGHRFGEKRDDGSIVLNINEVDLASRSGLSRETVSRQMHNIKDHGWVSIGNKNIVIKDMGALEKSLGMEI